MDKRAAHGSRPPADQYQVRGWQAERGSRPKRPTSSRGSSRKYRHVGCVSKKMSRRCCERGCYKETAAVEYQLNDACVRRTTCCGVRWRTRWSVVADCWRTCARPVTACCLTDGRRPSTIHASSSSPSSSHRPTSSCPPACAYRTNRPCAETICVVDETQSSSRLFVDGFVSVPHTRFGDGITMINIHK